eukprot:m.203227 g.203227  ORF g.203227 m.203227 type:complete len:454 (+) comp15759_c2_seq1:254-1615(+)
MSGNNSGSATVLVCESNKDLQSLLHTWLWTMGVAHNQVYTAENAIAACGKHKYDMILMDLDSQWTSTIGVSNGIEAVRILRTMDGPNKFTPVIGWTPPVMAPPMGIFLEDYHRHGFNDILRKPSSKEAVEALIKKWVGQVVETSALDNFNNSSNDQLLFDFERLPLPDFIFSEEPTSRSASVLVVEDCTLTQHVITSLLKELTPHVHQAFDGEQAIKMCDEQQFDIIFMDMGLPKIDGPTATQRIRKVGRNTWVPIIAFTSRGTMRDYGTIGVDDMLQKPFSTESLSRIFEKWTEHAKAGGGSSSNSELGRNPNASIIPPVSVVSNISPTIPQMMPPVTLNEQPELGMSYGQVTGGGKMKKDAPRNAHNIKERQRRQDISQAADNLRKIVPTLSTADKATVYKTTVSYVNFLRDNMDSKRLEDLDARFVQFIERNSPGNKNDSNIKKSPSETN